MIIYISKVLDKKADEIFVEWEQMDIGVSDFLEKKFLKRSIVYKKEMQKRIENLWLKKRR